MYFGILLGIIALAGGLVYRSRLMRATGPGETRITDDVVKQIEEAGWVDIDEPLDIDEIKEEEARFWEEPWDEPDEW
ncbi:hypothetical protein BH23GEM9_BH23GEM9_36550 [soil metagenome]